MKLVFALRGTPVPSFVLQGLAADIPDGSNLKEIAVLCDAYRTTGPIEAPQQAGVDLFQALKSGTAKGIDVIPPVKRKPTTEREFIYIRYDVAPFNHDDFLTVRTVLDRLDRQGVPPLMDHFASLKTGVTLHSLCIIPFEHIDPKVASTMAFEELQRCSDIFALVKIGLNQG